MGGVSADELKKEAESEQNPTGVLLSKSSRQVKAEKREEEDEDKYNKKFEDEVEPGKEEIKWPLAATNLAKYSGR